MKRVFLIVLDSFGVGELPDAADFGDAGASTVRSVSKSDKLSIPNMIGMGLGNIDGVDDVGGVASPTAACGKMAEQSRGKDTTVGHWEIAGHISTRPLPTYPDGFPQDVLDKLREATGREILCNKPYSGTDVIRDYGREQTETGALIVYTSADSVLQIAAHEDHIPIEELYGICRKARTIMHGEHGVGRIIARPYKGEYPNFVRTANRHDFSLEPTGVTLLDELKASGLDVIAVGKIEDIFAGRGVTEAIHTKSNRHGMEVTSELLERDFNGLCFVNLVEFDSHYGHRNDTDGYAAALSEFDRWLGEFVKELKTDDILIITADHGCDPGDVSTDHTREYTPLLVYGDRIKAQNLGVRRTFADTAATVAEIFGIEYTGAGESYADRIVKSTEELLLQKALDATKNSYVPYSGFAVGAALLTKDGEIYTGCNIENAAYSPTNCAERTAIFKAVSEGKLEFEAIAVVGGKKTDLERGIIPEPCPPCGVCRQVMMEFCDKDSFRIILGSPENYQSYTLAEILPLGFGKSSLN